jgi:hypothetical protein
MVGWMRIDTRPTGSEIRNSVRPISSGSTAYGPKLSWFCANSPTAPSIAVRPSQ